MKNKGRAAIFFLVLSGFIAQAQFSPCSYKYRKRITFDPTKVSGSVDLTDFPAMIYISSDNDLRTTANGGHVQNANGYDIVFTDADGTTQLPHDLNGYSASTGSLLCWVKLPTLSASMNTYIYMYYGNSSISTDQSSTSTWSNGYVGVWHFDNSLNNETSTSGLNGTNNGSTNTSTCKFISARNFASASSQYVDVTPYNSAYDLNSDITVTAWIRIASTGVDQKIAGNQDNTNGGWKFGVFSDNKIEFEIRTSGNSPFLSRSASGGSALAANTWYYVTGQYSDAGNYIKTYLNGSLDRNYGTTASCGTSSGTMKFGREPFAGSAYLNGIIDELRVSNVSRTAGWIATEYNNQNSPSTFYSISGEPKMWDGSSSGAWNTANNWTPSGVPVAGEDVIIPNGVTQPTLNTSASIGALWIYPSATLNCGGATRTISIAFDILNCGVITGSTGCVALNTSTIQTQYVAGTGTYNLTNLVINTQFNVSPQVELLNQVNVSGALTLSSGIVKTSTTNILALGTSATSSSGSSQSFVYGPISKTGTSNFVFPVGKGQEWRRIGISGITASTTFRAEYFNTGYANSTSVNSPLTDVSWVEYWQLDRTVGSGNAFVSLYWENVAYSGINDCNDLTIARWNGSSWDERAGTSVAGSGCSGSSTGTITTNAVVTAFSPFTFGSKTGGSVNVLPLQMSDITTECGAGKVKLSWSVYNTEGDSRYTLERSEDGLLFAALTEVKPQKGNASYTFTDDAPLPGTAYYRLRETDSRGNTEYSRISAAQCAGKSGIAIYPNPSTGFVNVAGIAPGSLVQVFTSSGQLYRSLSCDRSTCDVFIQDPGLYVVKIAGNSATASFKVLITR